MQRLFQFSFLFLILMSACAPAESPGGMEISNATVVLPGSDSMAGMQEMQMTSTLAGYLQIKNNSGVDDRLITVSCDFAHTMLHETQMNGDVARMKELVSIEIPAGGTVELKTGGYHIMFMSPKQGLNVGDHVNLTLHFEKAGKVTVDADVVGH